MSNNRSPEQQAALHASLMATINEINQQILYFENAITTHKAAIDRYNRLASQFPGLSVFMQAEVKDEYMNIAKLQEDINVKREYLAYYEQLMYANNPSMAPSA